MKLYRVYDIYWDCDGDEEVLETLPTEMFVEDKNNLDNEYELEDFISDEITDLTDFCHSGFNYEEVKILTKEDVINLVSNMKDNDLLDISAMKKDGNILAMGVERHNVMDGISVFLCNVYGSNHNFECHPLEKMDKDRDKETIAKVADYFFTTVNSLCGDNLQYLILYRQVKLGVFYKA